MANDQNEGVMGIVFDICRKADQDRREETPRAAELTERYGRIKLLSLGYSESDINDMYAIAMGQILQEDIERELSGE